MTVLEPTPEHARRELDRGQPPEMPLDGWAQVAVGIGNGDGFSAEANEARQAVGCGLQTHAFAPEEEFGPRPPALRAARLQGLPQELPLDPVVVRVAVLALPSPKLLPPEAPMLPLAPRGPSVPPAPISPPTWAPSCAFAVFEWPF